MFPTKCRGGTGAFQESKSFRTAATPIGAGSVAVCARAPTAHKPATNEKLNNERGALMGCANE